MKRNAGSVVDVAARTVRDRDGKTHALDVCEAAGGALYHARPIIGGELFDYHERWILPAAGWTVNRFRWVVPDHFDWYVEMDLIACDGKRWSVADGFVDVKVFEERRYEVEDFDELAEALLQGVVTVEETAAIIGAFDRVHRALLANGFSGRALIAEFAPSLEHHL